MKMLMIIDPDGIASLSMNIFVSLGKSKWPMFYGVLIHFRSGKFQALDMSYFSKGHAGFSREFWHDLCRVLRIFVLSILVVAFDRFSINVSTMNIGNV